MLTTSKKLIMLLITAFWLSVFLSCGPSEESIRQQTQQETKRKMEAKLALQESIEKGKTRKQQLENFLLDARGELEVAKDQLSRIKEWQFGRSTQERDEQIKTQTKNIIKLEKYIEELNEAIPATEKIINDAERQLQLIEAELSQ